MGSSGVKAASSAARGSNWNRDQQSGKQPAGNNQDGGVGVVYAPRLVDTISLSGLAGLLRPDERDKPEDEAYRQTRQLLGLMRRSNERVGSLAEEKKNHKLVFRAVPSTLGMPAKDAAAKLTVHSFRIADVKLEYSASTPAGHVCAQSPEPGSMALRTVGIKLVISKGAAPSPRKNGKGSATAKPGRELETPEYSERDILAILGIMPVYKSI